MTVNEERHVTDDELERMACHESSPAEARWFSEHVATCERCAQLWQAVEGLRSAAVEIDPGAVPASSPEASIPLVRKPWFVLAAAALVIGALGLPRWLERAPVDPKITKTEAAVVREATPTRPITVAPAEGAQLESTDFEWSGVPGASGYTIEIRDAGGERLWQSEKLEGSTTSWPADVVVEPGTYYWWVAAHFEDGDPTRRSELVLFEIVASP